MGLNVVGFGHVGIRVHDMERAVAFYSVLGFRNVVGPVGPEPVAILVHPCGLEINLIINASEADVPNPLMDVEAKLPGYTHIALEVDDLEGTIAALEAAGIALSGRMDLPTGLRAVFVRDPDRNVVELHWWASERPDWDTVAAELADL